MRSRSRVAVALPAALLAMLVLASAAFAHAHLSPPVAVAGETQTFALAVPTEKEGLATTKIELTLPDGFSIDSFTPSPGWKRVVQQTGSGEEAVIQKVTWAGGSVPTGEAATFWFLGRAAKSGSYSFTVQQTYSDGSIVNWSGPESAEAPSPVVEAKSSLGGGGNSTLTYVALAVAIVASVLAVVALVAGGGKRPLT
jgi:uncharacterized protein YcnI